MDDNETDDYEEGEKSKNGAGKENMEIG